MDERKVPARTVRVPSSRHTAIRKMLKPIVRGTIQVLLMIPGRRHIVRAFSYLMVILMLLSSIVFLYERYITSIEKHFFYHHMKNVVWTAASNRCSIPEYDPFDVRWRKYFFKPPPIACGSLQPFLTYVDNRGYIRINESGALAAGLDDDDFECMYSYIHRLPHDDFNITFTNPTLLRGTAKLQEPFVRVQCVRRPEGNLIYETGHAFVQPLTPQLSMRILPASSLRPSVLLLGLDSMSRLNFIRQLPKTLALLRDELHVLELNGIVKVGDNTYPNLLAMLTGYDAYGEHYGVQAPVWGHERKTNLFSDELPALWYNFSDNGYVTMYSEDVPEFNAFDFMAKGFDNPPTDYYMRPFWLGMDAMKTFRSRDERCYHNIPNYVYLFNYTRDFVLKMRDRRFFSLNFLTGFSHSSVNAIQVVDDALSDLLSELHRTGALRSAVLLVFGDHGNRFDAVRATVLGRVEERMPYMAIALPPDLREARPHLLEALRANRNTLVSWYDVYEMLADIALDNLQQSPLVERFGKIGYSLFRRVPARTCVEAGIPEEHCVCAQEVAISADDGGVQATARDLVDHVNALLRNSRWNYACAPLFLDTVLSAQKLLPTWQVSTTKGFSVTTRVTVRVNPSGALLEGALEHHPWALGQRVLGEVARINAYGNQSHCVRDPILRLYCFCKDLLLPRPTSMRGPAPAVGTPRSPAPPHPE